MMPAKKLDETGMQDLDDKATGTYGGKGKPGQNDHSPYTTTTLTLADIDFIKERKRSKATGTPVGTSYPPEDIHQFVADCCKNNHNVHVTEQLSEEQTGGQGYSYRGYAISKVAPERSLVRVIEASDESLRTGEAQKVLDSLRIQLKQIAYGRYEIEDVSVRTEFIPDSYFDDGVDRSTLPEYMTLYGEALMLPVDAESYKLAGEKQDLLGRIHAELSRINEKGKVHLNPSYAEDAFIKAITNTIPDTLFDELHAHLMLDGTGAVPKLIGIDKVELENGTTMPILITDFIEGQTLDKYMHGDVTESEKLVVFAKVARKLAKIHDAGWTHRDIKPTNILVTKEAEVFIIDLGSAAESYHKPFDYGMINSTPYYMTPEHIDMKVDPRMDIHSFGSMMMEMLTGESPFHDLSYEYSMANYAKDSEAARAAAEKVKATPSDAFDRALKKLYQAYHTEAFLGKTEDGKLKIQAMANNPERQKSLEEKLDQLSSMTHGVMAKCLKGKMVDRYEDCHALADALDQAALYMIVISTLDKDPVFGKDAVEKREARRKTPKPPKTPEQEAEDRALFELVAGKFIEAEKRDPVATGVDIGLRHGKSYQPPDAADAGDSEASSRTPYKKIFGIAQTVVVPKE
ncbi:protein kinase [Candidatus Woesearchaeota archaeon]|nr:protein kinase [Candidatus Woesearchaeota archaeon]